MEQETPIIQTTNVAYTALVKDKRLLDLSKESGEIYNKALDMFWAHYEQTGMWLSKFGLQAVVSQELKRKNLHSDTYIASIQCFRDAVTGWNKARKEFKFNPRKFTGEPQPPKRHKEIYKIVFKRKAIRAKNGNLILSLAKGVSPIVVPWDASIGKPVFVSISWIKEKGWQANFVMEKEMIQMDQTKITKDKMLSVDLGVKRTATTFDTENCVTYSGKVIMSLVRLRNKVNAATQAKLDKLTKHSRRYKHIKSKNRKVVARINNKINDILHKYSRAMVNYCIAHNIGEICFGKCDGIHDNPGKGRKNNQKIVQNPEQRLQHYVGNKFEAIGGYCRETPEPDTSKTCPNCGHEHKTNTRTFKCPACGFKYDRDGVGVVNIWGLGKNVSLGKMMEKLKELGVVGGLTPPVGWKYRSNQRCLIRLS